MPQKKTQRVVDRSPDVKNWAGKVHHSKVSRVKPLWSSEYLSTEYYTEIGKNTEIENITKTKGQIRFHIQILSGYLKHGLFIQVGWSNIEQIDCAGDAWTTKKISLPVDKIFQWKSITAPANSFCDLETFKLNLMVGATNLVDTDYQIIWDAQSFAHFLEKCTQELNLYGDFQSIKMCVTIWVCQTLKYFNKLIWGFIWGWCYEIK